VDNTLLIAALAVVTGGIGSWFTYLGTRNKTASVKIEALDARVRTLETRERILWMYCQTLILHINQGNPPPAPPWPAELNQLVD
jgi:hypothetical protein